MAYFEWADDLVIDRGPIDADHQKLVASINELHSATCEGRGQEIVAAVLDTLVSDTLAHVQREEQLMERLRYPHLSEHRAEHQKFLAQLQRLKQEQASGKITVAAQLSSALRDWLSIHIRRHDKKLFYYLQQSKRRP
jgi:hemerythrin-like metal-binding protein